MALIHCWDGTQKLGKEVLMWIVSTQLWLLGASSRGLRPVGLPHPGTNVSC
jgi:hypothetical protein